MTTSKDRSKAAAKLKTKKDYVQYFEANKKVRGYDMQVSRAHALSWNCDGTSIACGSQDRKVAVGAFDSSGRIKVTFVGQGHDESVDQVSFHHTNNHLFASASTDKSICLWDIRQSKTHTKLSTKSPNLYVTWSPCGRYLVYGDKEDTIHVIDGRNNLSTLKSHQFKAETNELVYHPSGKYLFVATGLGRVEIFSMPELNCVRTLQAHSIQSNCVGVAVTRDGERLAVGASDALCTVWSLDEMICERALSRLDYPVRAASFSADGKLLATGSEDHTIDIAYVDDGDRVHELRVDGETFAVAWHPRLPMLAYAGTGDVREKNPFGVRIFGYANS